MAQEWDLTDRDSAIRDNSPWRLSALNMPVVAVQPPRPEEELCFFMAAERPFLGGFVVSLPTEVAQISDELHDRLMELSLGDYGDIWRRLAGR
jgi:hypothetical protein